MINKLLAAAFSEIIGKNYFLTLKLGGINAICSRPEVADDVILETIALSENAFTFCLQIYVDLIRLTFFRSTCKRKLP